MVGLAASVACHRKMKPGLAIAPGPSPGPAPSQFPMPPSFPTLLSGAKSLFVYREHSPGKEAVFMDTRVLSARQGAKDLTSVASGPAPGRSGCAESLTNLQIREVSCATPVTSSQTRTKIRSARLIGPGAPRAAPNSPSLHSGVGGRGGLSNQPPAADLLSRCPQGCFISSVCSHGATLTNPLPFHAALGSNREGLAFPSQN